jgi:hypothetical protein
MKKLALLLVILPLAACQTVPLRQQQLAEAAEARDACTTAKQTNLDCVNSYLRTHYGWQVTRSMLYTPRHPANVPAYF